MRKNLNRRDFLKLSATLPAVYYSPQKSNFTSQETSQPNFIILVFDAWTASNMSLYGYPRQTTPFLDQLADKAIVYHEHYAGGHWTYPGTASLLTGVLPWIHRGYSQGQPILKAYYEKNIFGLFPTHNRAAYTHNHVADAILTKMLDTIDAYKPRQELYLDEDFWLSKLFWRDYDIASTAWVRVANKIDDGYASSVFLSRLYHQLAERVLHNIQDDYPLGVPVVNGTDYFLLDAATDWIAGQITSLPQPFLGYYHLLPPHEPYTTRREFVDTFAADDYQPTSKPEHILTRNKTDQELALNRRLYDEFILFVDSEINRLYNMLDNNNALENTWLIITSDHGEMFERGIIGHLEPTFHQPLMRVPLLIFPPGLEKRTDIYTPTTAIDVVPTLMHLSGKPIPNWLEGTLLPPYNTDPDYNRPIFGMDARYSKQKGPFTDASVMLRQGDYKLVQMFGDESKYEPLKGETVFELYNLKEDPEELKNLYNMQPEIAQVLLDKMQSKMKENLVL